MNMTYGKKEIVFTNKTANGAHSTKGAGQRKLRDFFSRMLEPLRPKSPEELLDRGNARRAEAKINLQEKGDTPEALEERLSLYRAALANFDKARNMVHGEASDLRREIRANRAECHLAMGYLYEMLGRKPDARRHYEKAVNIACAPLHRGNMFDERTRRAAEKADIGLERVWRG